MSAASKIKLIENMVADIFTKSLNKPKHEHYMKMLGLIEVSQLYEQINNQFKETHTTWRVLNM